MDTVTDIRIKSPVYASDVVYRLDMDYDTFRKFELNKNMRRSIVKFANQLWVIADELQVDPYTFFQSIDISKYKEDEIGDPTQICPHIIDGCAFEVVIKTVNNKPAIMCLSCGHLWYTKPVISISPSHQQEIDNIGKIVVSKEELIKIMRSYVIHCYGNSNQHVLLPPTSMLYDGFMKFYEERTGTQYTADVRAFSRLFNSEHANAISENKNKGINRYPFGG